MSDAEKLLVRVVPNGEDKSAMLTLMCCSNPEHESLGHMLLLADGFHILNADQDVVYFGALVAIAIEWAVDAGDMGKRAAKKIGEFYATLLETWDDGGFFEEDRVLN